MLVYEITSYQGCHPETSDESVGSLSLASEDEQIIGQPWDFQEKHDTIEFLMSTQRSENWFPDSVHAGSCDV